MAAFGFSLNMLSLFGLVLAIGIVVDDAIVVVENVERHIAAGLSPRAAAHKAMDEVTGAVIAIAFGLSAVFVPTAFIAGISGQFFRQFALTIAVSTMTLGVRLADADARPVRAPAASRTAPNAIGSADCGTALFGWFFRLFNRVVRRRQRLRTPRAVGWLVRRAFIALLVYGGLDRAHRLRISSRARAASSRRRTRAT